MSGEVFVRQCLNVAGLSLLVYDYILTWEDEIKYIWRDSTWIIRTSFLISRYLSLASQIVNIIYSSSTFIQRQSGDCLPWFKFQIAINSVLLWDMEFIMTMRVYALYGRTFRVGCVLAIWYLLCRVYNAWGLPRTLSQIETDIHCIPTRQPDGTFVFLLVIALNQAIYWYLSYRKYRSAVLQGWSEHPLIRVVIWDNSWAFLLCAGTCLSLIPSDFYFNQRGHIIFCALICSLSIISCRLILNTRALAREISSDVEQVELSTVLTTDMM